MLTNEALWSCQKCCCRVDDESADKEDQSQKDKAVPSHSLDAHPTFARHFKEELRMLLKCKQACSTD